MGKENDKEPKEPRAIRLAREHVQEYEIVGCDGLQDRMVTFEYYARYSKDPEELQEAAHRFIEESRRLFLSPDLFKPRDEK